MSGRIGSSSLKIYHNTRLSGFSRISKSEFFLFFLETLNFNSKKIVDFVISFSKEEINFVNEHAFVLEILFQNSRIFFPIILKLYYKIIVDRIRRRNDNYICDKCNFICMLNFRVVYPWSLSTSSYSVFHNNVTSSKEQPFAEQKKT